MNKYLISYNMKTKNMYEVPMLELILVQVEDGFAYSESGAFDDEYGDIVTPPMQ
jgi:hypothetical protein